MIAIDLVLTSAHGGGLHLRVSPDLIDDVVGGEPRRACLDSLPALDITLGDVAEVPVYVRVTAVEFVKFADLITHSMV